MDFKEAFLKPICKCSLGAAEEGRCWEASLAHRTDAQEAFTLEDDFGSVQGSYSRFGKSTRQGPRQEGAENLPVITLQENTHTACHEEGTDRGRLCEGPPRAEASSFCPQSRAVKGTAVQASQSCWAQGTIGQREGVVSPTATEPGWDIVKSFQRTGTISMRGDPLVGLSHEFPTFRDSLQ